MIYHFPPLKADPDDSSFLAIENAIFAKFKKENRTVLKDVFLTENVLVFVLKGFKRLHIENQTVEVTPQDIIFLKKGIYAMAEYFEQGEQFEAVLLFLDSKLLQEVIAEYRIKKSGRHSTVPFLKIPSNPAIEAFKAQLTLYFTQKMLWDREILLLKQQEILLYILKTVPRSQTIPFWDSLISTSSEGLVYIMDKYALENLSLKDYANLTNRSLSSFKRDFALIYRTSPKKWINQKRLEYSCLLLKNSEQRIADIAEKCGFESLSYYTQLFKRTFGRTPTEFRAEI
ncbi:helix-turn-helix transcriptional regulator [Flavobacterium sp. LPB0248]|uniref:helix-turn-helix transcriptional regulator n=1 Tax=Flavobacterium sp. LPB0248 TaxID=2614441 RepID=UPI0015A5AC37|nr:AraC family transcriptional regulator [Flavobacterium sp. LPB0248]QLC64799.1 helix-turn-helix transcriptional regulator [Flavobacterium sp. LPB0248]